MMDQAHHTHQAAKVQTPPHCHFEALVLVRIALFLRAITVGAPLLLLVCVVFLWGALKVASQASKGEVI